VGVMGWASFGWTAAGAWAVVLPGLFERYGMLAVPEGTARSPVIALAGIGDVDGLALRRLLLMATADEAEGDEQGEDGDDRVSAIPRVYHLKGHLAVRAAMHSRAVRQLSLMRLGEQSQPGRSKLTRRLL